jgi:hypothetical protein
VATALRARGVTQDGEQRGGVGDFGGLSRQRAQRGVLLIALFERAVAAILHGLERP